MRINVNGALSAVLSACMLFAASAHAVNVGGPTYPPINGGGNVTGSGGATSIGRAGGMTWTFAGVTPTAQELLWWGPAQSNGFNAVQLSFNNSGFVNPGETLALSSALSNLPGGVAIYTGQTSFTDGTLVATRFTMTYKVGGNPVALLAASTLGLNANSIGAVIPLTTPTNGFSVQMEFDAAFSSAGPFQAADDFYDAQGGHHGAGGTAYTSINGGYYFDTPPQIGNLNPASVVVQESSTSAPISFQVTDAETTATALVVTATSDTQAVIANANIALAGSGTSRTVTVTSTAQYGSANITLTVSDGLLSSSAVLPVRVNRPPKLDTNSPLAVTQFGSATITMSQLNAFDFDTAFPPIYLVQQPTGAGTLFLNGVPNPASFTQNDVNAGNVTYTQNGNCNSSDNFTFEVEDVDGALANDSGNMLFNFNILITSLQTAPTAQSASYQTALGGTVNGTLQATSSDCSNPAKTYAALQPSHGTLTFDSASGAFTYVAANGYNGSDSFTFTATTYGNMTSAPATISFDIQPRAPVAQNATVNTTEGAPVDGTLTATDPDVPPLPLTYAVATLPGSGNVVLNDASTGSFTYTPNTGATGQDSFTFTASNGTVTSAPATITINIQALQPPVAHDASINPDEDTPFDGTLTATDPNVPPLAITYALGTTLPLKGTVVLNDPSSGSFTYTPSAGAIGQDSFTFTASNRVHTSTPATITIDIRAPLHSGEFVIADDGNNGHPDSIVVFDPASHQQALVSTDPLLAGMGGGPLGVAIAADGKILVSTNSKIVRVDPTDGSATVFATGFGMTIGITVEASGNVLVADPTAGIVRLDGTTGARISTLSLGSGTSPVGIAVAGDTSLYVSQAAALFGAGPSNSIMHLNADGTGITTLTSAGHLSAPVGIVLDGGNLFVSNATFGPSGTNDVIQIDTTSGAQTVLTSGGNITNASGIAFDATQLYVVSQDTATIVGVDPTTGAQTPLTSGQYLHVPFSIAAVPLRASVTTITAETPDPSIPGSNYNVSVSVAAVFGSDSPTGTVAVSDGAGGTCTITLASGSGNCDLATATPGSFTITATYSGDAVFASSTATTSHDVAPYSTTTTITTTNPTPSIVGQSYTVGFSVSAASVTPTGTVTVSDDQGALCGPVTLTNGSGSCSLASTVAGTRTLTASYTPDTTAFSASSGTSTQVVNAANTAITIATETPDPSLPGQSVTVTTSLTVNAPGAGTPTGSIFVQADTSQSCTIALPATSCSLALGTVGSRTLTATYSGDTNFNTSSTSVSHTVNAFSTTLQITNVAPEPSVPAQSVTVQYSLTGIGAPTGNVTVTADSGESCLASIATGQCALAFAAVGAHVLTATYPGDATNASSSSSAVTHQVVKGSAMVSVVASPSPSIHGQAVSFAVTVAPVTPSSVVPGGSVLVSDGTDSCTATLVSGAGSCTFTPTLIGSLSITAGYSGDGNYATASGVTTLQVQQAQTTTAITSSLATATVTGEPVAVNFAVSAVAPGAGTPTGNVTVSAGTDSCTAFVAAATCMLTPTTAGAKTVTAVYSGDSNFSTSTSSGVAHTVNPASTTLTIQSHTPDPSTPAQTVTITVALAVTSPGTGLPSGTVSVGDGVNNCTITLPATSCGVAIITRGPRTLTASYGGDGNFLASTSAGVAHQVNRLPIANADAYTLNEGATLTVNAAQGVLANDTDADGNPLSVANPGTQTAGGIGGTVTLNADGSFSYAPPADASGTATFSYQLSDGLESVTGNVTLTVNLVNQPPTFTLESNPIWPAGTSGLKTESGFAQVTSFGPPNESGQSVLAWHVTVTSDPGGVTNGLQIQNDGTLIYSLTGQSGTAVITVTCQDNGGTANGGNDTSAAQTFQVSVGGGLDLSIGMTTNGGDFFNGGMLYDYTITVQNIGTTDAHNATVQDILPSNLLGATWTCDTIGAATCTASGSGDITDTVNIPKNAGLIYHLTVTVQAIPELPVVNTATITTQNGDVDVNPDNNTITLTDTVGIFRNGFESASSPQVITASVNAAQTQVIALDVAKAMSGAVIGAEPVLVTVVRNDSDQRAAAVHVRNYRGQTQVRLSWRGDDRLWRIGEWITVENFASVQLAWTTDRGLNSPATGRISLVEVDLLEGESTLVRAGEEP